ncbi:TonB-dependent receptor plug domain-containing protein [Lysobacter sp. TAF61]|uniref:TonB-dependent receptor plug domain-containing protein n=1 Tax=Lysobacter sp. TAF61 TaxID=3233072 RepID=UPI003F9CA6C0
MQKKMLASSINALILALASTGAVAQTSTSQASQSPTDDAQNIETVVVTGSRIARSQIEGPAPISVITAEEIKAAGFTSVPDVLKSLTQNGGETQSQQSSSGADFSPGAQQVDLRGLGPNHTLVLVNGRRIADFPMPYKGRSNFTDISGIPLGMIDRIEVLTGSASAVYGSDAIAGVVNFILKKHADGTTIDYRYGDTEDGGARSNRLSITSGFESGGFSAIGSIELTDQDPLWAYDRKIQDSSLDNPDPDLRIPRRTFLRSGFNGYPYIDPGQATCDSLSHLNGGTTVYGARPKYGPFDDAIDDYGFGYYCGSAESIGYGTIISERKGVNLWGSMSYQFGDGLEWFADVQAGYHEVKLFRDVTQWNFQDVDGNETGGFYNAFTGEYENWYRQFTPEEMGGLRSGMVETTQKTLGVTTGIKGTFAQNWDWEASLSHSQYKARISWEQIVAAKANEMILGPQQGYDDYGYAIFNADPANFYKPLTREQYEAISARSVYHPESRTDTLAFTVTNADLFDMKGGAAGFASVLEFGNQGYNLNPDPLAQEFYYFSWKDSGGEGTRNRWALASELRMPVLDSLNVSLAGRYDQYRYSDKDPGKFTYSAGLEWRPVDSLLVRGSYGTAFRAADLHYVYAQIGNDETSGTDFYRCRTEEGGIDDCRFDSEGLIRTREGNRDLDPETSTAWTAGMVWSPLAGLDFTLDYWNIQMRDQVQDMSVQAILSDEADCRIGTTITGAAVDQNSPTCVDAISRVTRLSNDDLYGIYVNPINIAREDTDGVDASAHYRWQTSIGTWTASANYTWVNDHTIQQFPGDPVIDEFVLNAGYDVPRNKANVGLAWEKSRWSASLFGNYIGSLPSSDNYDGVWSGDSTGPAWVDSTWWYNATVGYRATDRFSVTLTIDNLLDDNPPVDPTYTAYPYYDVSWFDSLGRSYYLQMTYKFGGG